MGRRVRHGVMVLWVRREYDEYDKDGVNERGRAVRWERRWKQSRIGENDKTIALNALTYLSYRNN